MTIDPHAQPNAFSERQPISDEEVLKLRRFVWADGAISPDEAAQLFALNDGAGPANGWSDFFVEAMCDYLIGRGQPRGYVTSDDADWLMFHVNRDGRIDSFAELELIVRLFERAQFVPESLKQFALAAIEQTILTGEGPTRRGREIAPGEVDEAEAALLRRLIFAQGSEAPAKVSRAEAELLFRIKDGTLGADNSPEWKRLFVQGVANHLMAHQAYVAPPAEDAARMERPYSANPMRVLGALGRPDVAGFGDALFGVEGDRVAKHASAVAQDAKVTAEESHWLSRLLEADGARDELEEALLAFLDEEGARPF
jgi:hypothetical protein